MATVYGNDGSYTTQNLISDLESTLGSTLASRILETLNSLQDDGVLSPNEPSPTVLSGFKPGETIPNSTAIVAFDPTVSGNVTTPNVPIVIYTSSTGVNTVVDATATSTVYFGSGNDTVKVSGSEEGTTQTFSLGAGNNTLDAADADGNIEVFLGKGTSDVTTGDGLDTFNMSSGTGGTVDGGAGFDVANFEGNASDYSVQYVDGKVVVTNSSTGAVTELENTNYINVGGKVYMVLGDDNQANAASFYEIVLGRSGDAKGAAGWTTSAGDGTDLVKIAEGFINSQEFVSKYGSADSMSNTDFVKLMYLNAFDRDASKDPLSDYWVQALNKGLITKAELVATLSKSLETDQKYADTIKVDTSIK